MNREIFTGFAAALVRLEGGRNKEGHKGRTCSRTLVGGEESAEEEMRPLKTALNLAGQL